MTADRARLVYDVIRATRPVVLASARHVGWRWGQYGITTAMRAVLELIERGGPSTVPDLARTLEISRQATQRTTDELVSAGLVAAQPNPAHRRSPLFALTQLGQDRFRSIHADELADLATMADGFSDEALEEALRVLATLHAEIARQPADSTGDGGVR